MFRSPLEVIHIEKKYWQLTQPLLWEGKWQYFIVKPGFETDFASIPRPARWLLDNAGRNSEAAVLHDAVWQESQRNDTRVDPWHADGIFRRALRQTGSTALARGIMWLAVRANAMRLGRFGKLGPSPPVKVIQLAAIAVLALISAGATFIVVTVGLLLYWIFSWIVAVSWYLIFERSHFRRPPNWPIPFHRPGSTVRRPFDPSQLVIVTKPGAPALAGGIPETAELEPLSTKIEELTAHSDSVSGEDLSSLLEANSRTVLG